MRCFRRNTEQLFSTSSVAARQLPLKGKPVQAQDSAGSLAKSPFFYGGDGEIRMHPVFPCGGRRNRIKQIYLSKRAVLLRQRWRDSLAFLFRLRGTRNRNRGVHQFLNWFTQMPYGICGHDSNLSIRPNRKATLLGGFSIWRRWRDSNSRRAFDPYTISNRARSTNYATSPCCSRMRLFNCQLAYYRAAFP